MVLFTPLIQFVQRMYSKTFTVVKTSPSIVQLALQPKLGQREHRISHMVKHHGLYFEQYLAFKEYGGWCLLVLTEIHKQKLKNYID